MSSHSLPGLPTELIVRIFELLPNCCAVVALPASPFAQTLPKSGNLTRPQYRTLFSLEPSNVTLTLKNWSDFKQHRNREYKAAEESKTDEPETDEADDAHHNVLKRNEYIAVNASIVSKECADLQTEAISDSYQNLHGSETEGLRRTGFRGLKRIRYRIHCIAALSSHRAAQDGYLEATSLDDLKGMRDDSAGTTPRHYYIDIDYFRIRIKTSWARNAFDSIEEVYRDECCRKYLN